MRDLLGLALAMPVHVASRLLLVAVGFATASITPTTAAAQTPAPPVPPVIVGRVVDAAGIGIAGVAIESPPGVARGYTDSTGAYRVAGAAAGATTLRARRLGYVPAQVVTTVPATGELRVDLRLVSAVQHLQPVEVRDRADPSRSRLAGFRDRAARRRGGGQFITRAQLDTRANTRLIEIIRELPGVRMRGPTRFADRSVRFRGADCPPLVFVDGFPATAGEFELDIIDLSTVEGIEIYPGLASVPAEFQATRALHRCGVIAVWSRPAPGRRQPARRTEQPARVAALVGRGDVYRAADVDQVAELMHDQSPTPIYPDSLWTAGVAGDVVMEVIVDTLGRAEAESISIVSATAEAFGAAARDALGESVFMVALKGGKRVRQVVHVPYAFRPPDGPG